MSSAAPPESPSIEPNPLLRPHPHIGELLSFERFLTDPRVPEFAEWVDGKVMPMHAVRDRHDEIVMWLQRLLGTLIEEQSLGRLLGEPFITKLGPDLPGRSPDLMFVADERLARIKELYLDGPPDLAIEVTSPSSRVIDRSHKFADYERAGVTEYWLIDPEAERAEFFQHIDGRLEPRPPVDGVYAPACLPDARLRVAWLWERPMPRTLPILREWGVV